MILCSVFALLSLHLFLYGCNLFMWKNTRINYNFIFEFSPTTALKHRDAFLMSTTLMTTVVGAMVLHLLLRAADFSPTQIDAIPGILLLVCLITIHFPCCLWDKLVYIASNFEKLFILTKKFYFQFFIALLICPFDIFYRPTRYCFIRVIRNIVCSPFYKVNFPQLEQLVHCKIRYVENWN